VKYILALILVLCSAAPASEISVISRKGALSGIVIGRHGSKKLVLTCLHGVEQVNWVEENVAPLVHSNEEYDMALLLAVTDAEPATLGYYLLPGDRIRVKGYAGKDRDLKEYSGFAKCCMLSGDMRCSLSAHPGMSGSPVLNQDGLLVGMIWGCTDDEKQAAVSGIGKIRRFLESYNKGQQVWTR
jgi:hypothetical protein